MRNEDRDLFFNSFHLAHSAQSSPSEQRWHRKNFLPKFCNRLSWSRVLWKCASLPSRIKKLHGHYIENWELVNVAFGQDARIISIVLKRALQTVREKTAAVHGMTPLVWAAHWLQGLPRGRYTTEPFENTIQLGVFYGRDVRILHSWTIPKTVTMTISDDVEKSVFSHFAIASDGCAHARTILGMCHSAKSNETPCGYWTGIRIEVCSMLTPAKMRTVYSTHIRLDVPWASVTL